VRHIGRKRHLAECHLLVGALDREGPVLELDIGLRRFHHVGGDLLGLGLDLVEGARHGAHAHSRRPRAVGAHAELHLVGVAVHDGHLVDVHAEALGHQLRKHRFVALAVAVRTGQHFNGAGRVHPDLGRFPQADTGPQRTDRRRRGDTAGLDVAGEADAAGLPLRAAAALRFSKPA
jgi:hypothetical protein